MMLIGLSRFMSALFRMHLMRGDPRVIAVGIAAGFMLLDDLPESQYNTSHDPGAASMLSVVFSKADGFSTAEADAQTPSSL